MAPQRYSVTPHPIVQRLFVWEATLGDDAFLVRRRRLANKIRQWVNG